MALLATVLLGLSGCGDKAKTLDEAQRKLFGPPPKELVAMAFDPDDADRRREGIIGLSKKDWGLQEPYLKGYASLLKTDANETVRAAAARALGKARNLAYIDTLVDALFDESEMVRWDAALALDAPTFVDRRQSTRALRVLVDASAEDKSPDVRAAAAKVLRNYRRPEAVQALVKGLRDDKFVVRWQAHASLVELSGRDNGMNAADWAGFVNELTAAPTPAAGKPWWDWAGVTNRPQPSPASQPTSRPAASPREK